MNFYQFRNNYGIIPFFRMEGKGVPGVLRDTRYKLLFECSENHGYFI